jgi:hypothetical protein
MCLILRKAIESEEWHTHIEPSGTDRLLYWRCWLFTYLRRNLMLAYAHMHPVLSRSLNKMQICINETGKLQRKYCSTVIRADQHI